MTHRSIPSVRAAQQLARRRLPRSVYRFIEGGTEAEWTVRENEKAFEEVLFRPHAAVETHARSLERTVLGDRLSMPVVVAPTGMVRLAHRDGEVGAARAAGAAGTAIGISTLSSYPIEQIVASTAGPVWYQLYFAGGREGAELALERARAARCTALLVTVDLAASASRERSLRGGAIPTRVTARTALRYAPEMVLRPAWAFDFLRDGGRLETPNVQTERGGPPLSAAAASASMRSATPTWADLAWIREQWNGKIAMKGILSAEDARRSHDHGVDGVIVSNHGGNALDGTEATLRLLPEIVNAVGDDLDVLIDGGVRRGADVAKAVALGRGPF